MKTLNKEVLLEALNRHGSFHKVGDEFNQEQLKAICEAMDMVRYENR